MKRISIAEQTLKKQMEILTEKINAVSRERDLLNEQIRTYEYVKHAMITEFNDLKGKREKMGQKGHT